MRGGLKLCRRGVWLARFGVVRLVLRVVLAAGSPWLSGLLLYLGSGRIVRGGERIVSALGQLPTGVSAVLRAHWSRPSFFRAVAGEIAALTESARQAAEAGSLRDIPLVVLSAARSGSAPLEAYERMARLSSRGKHVVAEASDHFIILDQPEMISGAVREIVETARRSS